ncbi:MAG TPA: Rieske (2Fe-2S) protein [Nitriliruptorales bacterium]|nr:Rieske (2Fe-2S) protein [Nitriliruptorales bacterium]
MSGPSGRWVRAAAAADVSGERFVPVEVAGHRLLLGRLADGRVVAFNAACPHQGQPMDRGEVVGGTIVCPHHRYGYDARTGANVAPPAPAGLRLPVYAVEQREGWLWVALPEATGQ